MSVQFDLNDIIRKAVETAFKELSTVTVLIAGRTGVGKSTLINAVFAGNMATTGQGRPITTSTREYTKDGVPLRIIDTRGLETAAYAETQAALEKLLDERQREPQPERHIHVAWVCISEDSRRVEQSDIDLHEILRKRNIPVVGVVTKARKDKDREGKSFRSVVQELLPHACAVVRVRAEAEEDDDGHSRPPMGLADLVVATQEVVPEGHRRALIAAQKVAIDQKASAARGVVLGAATAAAGAAAVPIPFSDAFVIVPIQVVMLAGVSATFGLPVTETTLTTLVGSVVGAGGAALAGRALAGALIKMIPGAGSIVGGVIAAATASALTVTLGEAYIAALRALFEARSGEAPTEQEVVEEFTRQLSRKAD